MKTGTCRCDNRIFFDNHTCVSCEASLGRCTVCDSLTSFTQRKNRLRCDTCEVQAYPCINQEHGICQCYNAKPGQLCVWCAYTRVIPPLDQPESIQRWSRMESAKRRLLLQLKDLGLPPFVGDTAEEYPLLFEFREDSVDENGNPQKVITGHQNGLITINLKEADSVHRETLRVQLGEPQRTLIGHMRHEVGHYIDWSWAMRVAKGRYHELFGDPDAIDYSEAMKRHYESGPPADWADQHVSAYATMHPWEDFAETVNVYLDIMAIATTSNALAGKKLDLSADADHRKLVQAVLKIVIEVSEYNLDLGLLPLLPEQLSPAVLDKLAFIHELRSAKKAEPVA
ncbi:putative zinc-binding metallopeptidase [Rhodopirellula sp. JC740]|uniref:Zinc-binding metallopeptidase n=1 Tax=Rhodopirellula halodulae TaxID=2894198 RepID=A0ABS8NI42_9BACT|nr:putative zinc-binding metallopeptidase [Rhodopirellula sp. JC740]MCC9643225.1 putative zinc-binding metallopeptidase [Rhodopirellula sp. JC740]